MRKTAEVAKTKGCVYSPRNHVFGRDVVAVLNSLLGTTPEWAAKGVWRYAKK